MTISNKSEPFILFLGDIAVFVVALWLTLFVRYGEVPSGNLFFSHLEPFSILFVLWSLVFFIAGLYDKHTSILKSRLPGILLNSQVTNSAVAVIFFYLFPYFGINPKTNLLIYLVISFALILLWRIYGVGLFGSHRREKAVLIGSGEEMRDLRDEINGNDRYSIKFVSSVDLSSLESFDFKSEVLDVIYAEGISAVVIDLKNEKVGPILPNLYNLIFSNVKFIDMYKVYEDTFDRIPLSLLNYNWFLENISLSVHAGYDVLKRLMDLAISLILGIISLVFYPFVFLAIKLEDGGPVFIAQERIGEGNIPVRLIKFRSMKKNDSGVWPTDGDGRITGVGKFLRRTRIDELPQLWSVVTGDLSLIGPRPDIIDLGRKLAGEIPYYTVRNLIKPGLSGWAQIKQDLPPHSVEETKLRLSYDLYYIKNRSFMLDLRIALQTIKTLLSRSGK
ncbi:MAG: sugar transferase [Candidatus Paceibacterota bacterium]|jgi:lipopolysaccharide/colanic/teichoic acid biosynthesis glycosyltransferase